MVRKTIKCITTVCASLFVILLYLLFCARFKNNLVKFNTVNTLPEKKCENNSLFNNSINWKNLTNVHAHCTNRIIIVSQYRTGSSFFGLSLYQ